MCHTDCVYISDCYNNDPYIWNCTDLLYNLPNYRWKKSSSCEYVNSLCIIYNSILFNLLCNQPHYYVTASTRILLLSTKKMCMCVYVILIIKVSQLSRHCVLGLLRFTLQLDPLYKKYGVFGGCEIGFMSLWVEVTKPRSSFSHTYTNARTTDIDHKMPSCNRLY